MKAVARNPVGDARSLVKEARSLEVGEVHSLGVGTVVVADSHVAAPDLGRRRTSRPAIRRLDASPGPI